MKLTNIKTLATVAGLALTAGAANKLHKLKI